MHGEACSGHGQHHRHHRNALALPSENPSKNTNLVFCDSCGMCNCFKRKTRHYNQDCSRAEGLNELKKPGMIGKKCPKCAQGVFKKAGCHHMTCPSCGTHFCWLCLEVFVDAKSTYDHLVEKHRRITIEQHYGEEF